MKTAIITFLSLLLFSTQGFSQKKKIKDFSIVYDSSANFAPGSIIPLGVKAIWKNNKIKTTTGILNGKLAWNKFNVTVMGGKFLNNGNLLVDGTIEERNNKVTVTISPIENPRLEKSIDIMINYRGIFTVDYSGYDGRDGRDGRDGGEGSNGSNGSDGENGGDGYPIDVLVKLAGDNTGTYLKIMVYNVETEAKAYYKLNPVGGTMYIYSKGGNGGRGGKGGNGGNGYSNGEGGNGGDGGNGGNGGNGARIRLYLEGDAQKFRNNFILVNVKGIGGKGGKKGAYGDPGSNFKVEDRKTIVGKLLVDQGYGKSGSKGYDGRDGGSGPAPEVVESLSLEFEW